MKTCATCGQPIVHAAVTRPHDPDAYVHADRAAVTVPHDAHPDRVDPRPGLEVPT